MFVWEAAVKVRDSSLTVLVEDRWPAGCFSALEDERTSLKICPILLTRWCHSRKKKVEVG